MVQYTKGIVNFIRHPWDDRRLNEIWVEGSGLFVFRKPQGYVNPEDARFEAGSRVLTKDDIPFMVFPYPNLTERRLDLMGQVKNLDWILARIKNRRYDNPKI